MLAKAKSEKKIVATGVNIFFILDKNQFECKKISFFYCYIDKYTITGECICIFSEV